jgi:hypothetical protein
MIERGNNVKQSGFTLALGVVSVAACALLWLDSSHAQPAATQTTAKFGTNQVSITVSGGERVINANGIPDHKPGDFPRRGNPNSISAQSYNLKVPSNPKVAAQPVSAAHALFGVALNGVPFDPATAEFWNNDRSSGWNYEANTGFLNLGLDEHNAHVQPTGAYHYHGLPQGLIARLERTSTTNGAEMLLIGWAADGFPIYTQFGHASPTDAASSLKKLHSSYRVKKGTRPGGPGGTYDGRFTSDFEYVKGSGDLDECNGRFGVTPEYPEGIYHYYITEEFPFISRYWKGTPDPSFMHRGPGPGGPGGRRGPDGRGGRGPGGEQNHRPGPRGEQTGNGLDETILTLAANDAFAPVSR